MKKASIIVAGGKGLRMNSNIPKQFLLLRNKPILMHTLEKFSHFDEIVLVLPKTQINYWKGLCNMYNFTISHTIVSGGKTRFHSVKNGLKKIKDNMIVAIHDGIRPLISKKLIDKLISEIKTGVGVIPVIPTKDSMRKIENRETTPINRDNLYKVQTPQCFISNEIKESYAKEESKKFTDDSSVFENNGGIIRSLMGEEKNLKITTQEDLKIALALYK